MRLNFEEQLEQLKRELILTGALCENAIALAAKAITSGSSSLAGSVLPLAEQIDRKEREVEELCLKLLLQQQPVAKDLRVVSSALKMVTDMERIGNQSADIAEIAQMAHISGAENRREIHDMAASVIKMVTESINAFVKEDEALAKAVIDYDDVVDGQFNTIKEMLIGQLNRPETDGEQIIDLLMAAKYLERIGDHAVNIAKWVVFAVTGNIGG